MYSNKRFVKYWYFLFKRGKRVEKYWTGLFKHFCENFLKGAFETKFLSPYNGSACWEPEEEPQLGSQLDWNSHDQEQEREREGRGENHAAAPHGFSPSASHVFVWLGPFKTSHRMFSPINSRSRVATTARTRYYYLSSSTTTMLSTFSMSFKLLLWFLYTTSLLLHA